MIYPTENRIFHKHRLVFRNLRIAIKYRRVRFGFEPNLPGLLSLYFDEIRPILSGLLQFLNIRKFANLTKVSEFYKGSMRTRITR